MKRSTIPLAALAVAATLSAAVSAQARDQIRIVGSSTVFPFATAVAEEFGKTSGFKTPVVESTGTGGGLKLFCSGVGVDFPDIADASRRIKKTELDNCVHNGVSQITEVKIGFDGIVFANGIKAPHFNLTRQQLFLAMARSVPRGGKLVPNPNKTWDQIDPSLPKQPILVFGPAPNHGTRDAMVDLVMTPGCEKFPAIAALSGDAKKEACEAVREDSAFVEVSETYNVTLEKLTKDPNAVGVFGYSYYDNNRDKVQASTIEGVDANFDTISSQKYAVSRYLYFYVKGAHVGAIPGMKEFIAQFTSDKAWGPNGYLSDKGLIPLPDADRKTEAENAKKLAPLAM